MQRAARGMRALELRFDTIISSPYLRACQTAQIVAKTYKIKNYKIHLTNHMLPPASIKELLREVTAHFPQSQHILFVGHEPHLTELVSSLLKSKDALPINFKKGALCSLTLTQNNAALNWILTSTQLGLLKPRQ